MIALLTDFGDSEYVGIMKGVIASNHHNAKIIDFCHTISSQNIIEASWVLSKNYQFFPPGTIFCVVVDPGVGTDRFALAIKTEKYYFLGPDNGVLWESLKDEKIEHILRLEIPENASKTFHGRDVFSKAAALIDKGEFLSLGKEHDSLKELELHKNGREGIIVRVDHYGNMLTNLEPLDKKEYTLEVSGATYTLSFSPTYKSAGEGLFLITSSNKTLEISIKNANAHKELPLQPGDKVKIT